jgi:hypothetical protein
MKNKKNNWRYIATSPFKFEYRCGPYAVIVKDVQCVESVDNHIAMYENVVLGRRSNLSKAKTLCRNHARGMIKRVSRIL